MESTTEENWMVRNSSQSETATAFSRLHEHFEQGYGSEVTFWRFYARAEVMTQLSRSARIAGLLS
jgi:hypothetical protein